MPVDNSEAAAAAQRKGFVVRHNYVGSGQGSVVRITEFAPGAPKFMHRTETVDYAILLSGECDLELDDRKMVHLKQRSEEHTSELQSRFDLVCRLLLEKKKKKTKKQKKKY